MLLGSEGVQDKNSLKFFLFVSTLPLHITTFHVCAVDVTEHKVCFPEASQQWPRWKRGKVISAVYVCKTYTSVQLLEWSYKGSSGLHQEFTNSSP